MDTTNNNPGTTHDYTYKNNNKPSQIKVLTECFSNEPKTMYQVERETGIRIANICRFIGKMKKLGVIRRVYRDKCPISHRQAGFYTSNQKYFRDKEPSLFGDFWNGIKLKL